MALVDGNVGISVPIGIGICDRNPSKRLPPDHARTLRIRAVQRFEEAIVFVGITMRPPIDSDCLDVRGRIESPSRKHAAQLIAHLMLKGFELRAEQFPSSRPVLVLAGQSGLAR